jgi:ubiquinol-cytochrome c reductase cytochrome b subunit
LNNSIQTVIGIISITDPYNSIEINRIITPLHIIPEWYFLWLYLVLKVYPNKVIGVFTMIITLLGIYLIIEYKYIT